jgi:hypothetical protein
MLKKHLDLYIKKAALKHILSQIQICQQQAVHCTATAWYP